MLPKSYAVQAYRVASRYKSQRDTEADVFRLVVDGIKAGRLDGPVQKAKAIADNRRLWQIVQSIVSDPANQLPQPLRALILSLSLTVQREMSEASPDLDFLISINDLIIAGLVP